MRSCKCTKLRLRYFYLNISLIQHAFGRQTCSSQPNMCPHCIDWCLVSEAACDNVSSSCARMRIKSQRTDPYVHSVLFGQLFRNPPRTQFRIQFYEVFSSTSFSKDNFVLKHFFVHFHLPIKIANLRANFFSISSCIQEIVHSHSENLVHCDWDRKVRILGFFLPESFTIKRRSLL